jgi:hypothetical protein
MITCPRRVGTMKGSPSPRESEAPDITRAVMSAPKMQSIGLDWSNLGSASMNVLTFSRTSVAISREGELCVRFGIIINGWSCKKTLPLIEATAHYDILRRRHLKSN